MEARPRPAVVSAQRPQGATGGLPGGLRAGSGRVNELLYEHVEKMHPVGDRKSAVLGHPLWPVEDVAWLPEQEDAVRVLRGSSGVGMFDLYTARRWPERIVIWLDA